MQRTALVLTLLATATLGGEVSPQFRSDYTYLSEAGGWLKLHLVPATWSDARYRCHLEGALLASPVSGALHEGMSTALDARQLSHAHTGTHARWGDYISLEGATLASFPNKYEPTDLKQFKKENECLSITSKGHMGSIHCDDMAPYMCFKRQHKHMVVTNCGTTDMGYRLETRTNSCYKFHAVAQAWHQALLVCAGEGGHLAVINSETEAHVLKELFEQHPLSVIKNSSYANDAAIGFHKYDKTGDWLTIEGETLEQAGFSVWGSGQPNTGDVCGGIGRSGLLNDEHCHTPVPFICEMTPGALQQLT